MASNEEVEEGDAAMLEAALRVEAAELASPLSPLRLPPTMSQPDLRGNRPFYGAARSTSIARSDPYGSDHDLAREDGLSVELAAVAAAAAAAAAAASGVVEIL